MKSYETHIKKILSRHVSSDSGPSACFLFVPEIFTKKATKHRSRENPRGSPKQKNKGLNAELWSRNITVIFWLKCGWMILFPNAHIYSVTSMHLHGGVIPVLVCAQPRLKTAQEDDGNICTCFRNTSPDKILSDNIKLKSQLLLPLCSGNFTEVIIEQTDLNFCGWLVCQLYVLTVSHFSGKTWDLLHIIFRKP